jgi:flagellar hook protein FlgE
MLRSLNSAVSGMQEFQQSMDVIGNNVANVNTTGFKSARVDFEEAFSQQMSAGPGGIPMQVGTGVNTAAITNQYMQGAISNTGKVTDVAVSGNGFFVVQNTLSGAQYVSRDGAFHLDDSGYLVTNSGLRVQGYSDAGLSARGDIQIDSTGAPNGSTASVETFNIDSDGMVNVRLTDGTEFVRGQVLLQTFQNPQALTNEGGNLFSVGPSAGALSQAEAPGTNGLGKLVSGALEMSNVDLANEFSNLIVTQRAFQASARIITTSDEILQELVNLKR